MDYWIVVEEKEDKQDTGKYLPTQMSVFLFVCVWGGGGGGGGGVQVGREQLQNPSRSGLRATGATGQQGNRCHHDRYSGLQLYQ